VPLELLTAPDAGSYYPREAKGRHLSGHTLVHVCVDAGAHLISVQIVQSSGFPQFDEAAIKMVHHMQWRAATLDTNPIPDCRPLVVNFLWHSSSKAASGAAAH
jgi:TonB family protein